MNKSEKQGRILKGVLPPTQTRDRDPKISKSV